MALGRKAPAKAGTPTRPITMQTALADFARKLYCTASSARVDWENRNHLRGMPWFEHGGDGLELRRTPVMGSGELSAPGDVERTATGPLPDRALPPFPASWRSVQRVFLERGPGVMVPGGDVRQHGRLVDLWSNAHTRDCPGSRAGSLVGPRLASASWCHQLFRGRLPTWRRRCGARHRSISITRQARRWSTPRSTKLASRMSSLRPRYSSDSRSRPREH